MVCFVVLHLVFHYELSIGLNGLIKTLELLLVKISS